MASRSEIRRAILPIACALRQGFATGRFALSMKQYGGAVLQAVSVRLCSEAVSYAGAGSRTHPPPHARIVLIAESSLNDRWTDDAGTRVLG